MRLLGILLIITSATSFGAMPIFAHFAYASGITPLTALFFRFAIAAICLCTYLTIRILILRRPSSPTKLTALGIALLGTVLTIGSMAETQALGVVLGLISASAYAIYVLIGEQVMQEESSLAACTVMISSAAIVYGGIVAIRGISCPTLLSGWFALVALALISTVLAIGTLFAGIKLLGAPTAAMLSTLEPVITIVLSMMVLHQSVTTIQLIGGALILTAIIVIATEKRAKQPTEVV